MMVIEISIHALRGEGDRPLERLRVSLLISIHALRGEGDSSRHCWTLRSKDFNPRPPRGGRRAVRHDYFYPLEFQSTPSEGRATFCRRYRLLLKEFQSTPSEGRATGRAHCGLNGHKISIHALRGEGDIVSIASLKGFIDFNPRPPRGGRLNYVLLGVLH